MGWVVDVALATWTKEVVTTIATCFGVGIAWSGLNTWKRQLTGQTEYELTRRLLRCTYILREALRAVRRPELLSDEQVPPDDRASLTEKQIRYSVMNTAYRNRWAKVLSARADLQTELIQGEVMWGKSVSEKYERLFTLQQELLTDVNAYLIQFDPDANEASKAASFAIQGRGRTVNFELPGARRDPFWIDVESAISDIESYLKPHLAK